LIEQDARGAAIEHHFRTAAQRPPFAGQWRDDYAGQKTDGVRRD
jgi:hypothetical protein